MRAAQITEEQQPLAKLRPELQFSSAATEGGLAREGVIFDPVRHKYFRIDAATAELLALWPECRNAGHLAEIAAIRFGLLTTEAHVRELQSFLTTNQLTEASDDSGWKRLAYIERNGKHGWLAWSAHNYLFMRIPLFNPEKLLSWLSPRLLPVFTPAFAIVIALIGAAGLYLTSRQWDVFIATFPHLFSIEGAVLYAIALGLVKTLHEFGHAVVAARYGCRIPSMGICFIVMAPMLYTDVTDAWRLTSPRQRLAIGAAGLIVETAIACIATFAWAFLPDGMWRSLAFALATTSWMMSLGMNLNPFMRFDGYYLLSDLIGIENLQPRAFEIGCWRLREFLFGLGNPPPEPATPRRLRWMAIYAYAVWLYRLIVFTGIALFVYHMSFKVLGIVLFAIEIIFFIALPIWREVKEWYVMRPQIIESRRSLISFALAASAVALAFVPLSTSVAVPAIVEDEAIEQIFPKRPAMVVEASLKRGSQVATGDVLVTLTSPELDHDIRRAQLELAMVTWRLERRSADQTDRAETLVLEDRQASLKSKLSGLEKERSELKVTAHMDGVIVDAESALEPGRWLRRQDLIALIATQTRHRVRGYVSERDVSRVVLEAPATFVPEDPLLPSSTVELTSLAAAGSETMEIISLSSHYGGGVTARSQQRRDPRQRLDDGQQQISAEGQFQLSGITQSFRAPPTLRTVRGVLHTSGRAESLAARVWRQVLKVLVRESGF